MIKATIVGCIDYRFQKMMAETISKYNLNYGDYDLISIPGGAGNFNDLERYLKISIKLHNPQTIILVVHEDCGYKCVKEDLGEAYNIVKGIVDKDVSIYIEYLEFVKS